MKGREKQALATMSVEELQAKLAEGREAQFRLKFRHATNPLKNPMEIRFKRKEIARLETFLNNKTKGISK